MTCERAQGFLESAKIDIVEKVDARKNRIGRDEALALLKGMKQLVAARGKKVVSFDLVNNRPDHETLLAHLLGPTGNLRAPTAKVGTTMVVGFSEETYRKLIEER
jgi:arsenate reductase-like glutaredoxin family protein